MLGKRMNESRMCRQSGACWEHRRGSTASSSASVFGKLDILNGAAALEVLGPAGCCQVFTTAETHCKVPHACNFYLRTWTWEWHVAWQENLLPDGPCPAPVSTDTLRESNCRIWSVDDTSSVMPLPTWPGTAGPAGTWDKNLNFDQHHSSSFKG